MLHAKKPKAGCRGCGSSSASRYCAPACCEVAGSVSLPMERGGRRIGSEFRAAVLLTGVAAGVGVGGASDTAAFGGLCEAVGVGLCEMAAGDGLGAAEGTGLGATACGSGLGATAAVAAGCFFGMTMGFRTDRIGERDFQTRV